MKHRHHALIRDVAMNEAQPFDLVLTFLQPATQFGHGPLGQQLAKGPDVHERPY